MPEVVNHWLGTQDRASCFKLQQDLMATYRDDFHKYHETIDVGLLIKTVRSVSDQMGNKFIYSRVEADTRAYLIKSSLRLLFDSRLCSKVAHTAANRLPLGAESNSKFFKALLVDTGLAMAQLGQGAAGHDGGLAEHFVGQQLRSIQTPETDPDSINSGAQITSSGPHALLS